MKIIGLIAALSFASMTPAWTESLPRLALTSLTHRPFVFPDDAHGAAVFFVGFSQMAGSNIKPWTDRYEKDFGFDSGCPSFTVAVLAGVPAFFRPLTLGIIENGTPSNRRDAFLVTFTDEIFWKSLVEFQSPDEPYILILSRNGVERLHGSFDERLYQKLVDRVRLLISSNHLNKKERSES